MPFQLLCFVCISACLDPKDVAPWENRLPISVEPALPLALELGGDEVLELRVYSYRTDGTISKSPELRQFYRSLSEPIQFTPPSIGPKRLALRLVSDNRLIASGFVEMLVEPGKKPEILKMALDPLPPDKQQAEYQISLALFESVSDLDSRQGIRFFEVEDVFDNYSCTVCHGEGDPINLRQYPFAETDEENTAILKKISRQIENGSMPPRDLTKVPLRDQDRLVDWINDGALPDRTKSSSEIVKSAEVFLVYTDPVSGDAIEIALGLIGPVYKGQLNLRPDDYYDLKFVIKYADKEHIIARPSYRIQQSGQISEVYEVKPS